jgi:hypothetical protein
MRWIFKNFPDAIEIYDFPETLPKKEIHLTDDLTIEHKIVFHLVEGKEHLYIECLSPSFYKFHGLPRFHKVIFYIVERSQFSDEEFLLFEQKAFEVLSKRRKDEPILKK